MPKPIFNLIYASTASIHFTREKLTELLIQSRRDNMELRITGLLLYANGGFMQLLEGSKDRIDFLMERIKKDTRHRQVDVLEQGYIAERQFPNWSMAFLDFADPQVRRLPGYSNFLDCPFKLGQLTGTTSQSVHLLHSFMAIMSASNDNVLKLAEAIKAGD